MALVFVRKGATLVPAWVKSAYIVDVDTIENDSMWVKEREDLKKLPKSDLIDLLSRGDASPARDNVLDKKREKMTKTVLADQVFERFDAIVSKTTETSNIFKYGRAMADALGNALSGASSSGEVRPPRHGYENMAVHAKRARDDVKAYRVFMQGGHLMASTAYGCYEVAEPDEVMDWLLTHNHVMLSREDARDEHGSDVEKDSNSTQSESEAGSDDGSCTNGGSMVPDLDDLQDLSPRYLNTWDDDIKLVGINLTTPKLSLTAPMYTTLLEVKTAICEAINAKQEENVAPVHVSDFILKHGMQKMQDDHDLTTYTANGEDALNVRMELRLRGGGKRGRNQAPEDKDENPTTLKDLKEAVRDGVVQLKSIQSPSPTTTEAIEKAEFILQTIETNPKTSASNLIALIPRDKLGTIVAGTLPAGSRPMTRLRYVSEHSMADLFKKLESLAKQEQVATRVLCQAVHCAILAEHGDHQGQIGWGSLFKVMLERITSPPSENTNLDGGNANRCSVM